MNISLTNRCSRRCEYCFQKDWFLESEKNPLVEMPVELFNDILHITGEHAVVLMGGEPLLYSHLDEVLTICDNVDVAICFFSNISVPSETVEMALTHKCVRHWLINSDFAPTQENLFFANLWKIANRCSFQLGSTLMPDSAKIEASAEHMRKILMTFEGDVIPGLRLSFATPSLGNADYDNDFRLYDYSRDIVKYINILRQEHSNIKIGFDCPVSGCELNPLIAEKYRDYISCSYRLCIDPTTDIMPDGSVIWCSSARFIKLPDIRAYDSLDAIGEALGKQWRDYWSKSVRKCAYKACSMMDHLQCFGLCSGKNFALEHCSVVNSRKEGV